MTILRRIFIFIGILVIIIGGFLTYLLRAPEVRAYEIGIRRLKTYIFRYDTIDVHSAWVRIDQENLVVETYIRFDVTDVYGNRHHDFIALTYAGGPNDKDLEIIRPGDDNYDELINPVRTDTIVPKWEVDYYYAPPALSGYITIANGFVILVLAIIFKPSYTSNFSSINFNKKPEIDVIEELREAKELFDQGKISRIEFNRRKNELL